MVVNGGAFSLSFLPLTISARLETFLESLVSVSWVGVTLGGDVPPASLVGSGGKLTGARSRLC